MELDLEEYQQLLGDLKGLEIGTLHMERKRGLGEEEMAYNFRAVPRRIRSFAACGANSRSDWPKPFRICPTASGW